MKEIASLPAICCGPATEPLAVHERDQLAAQFKALADPTRIAIVNQLAAADEVCQPVLVCWMESDRISHYAHVPG